MQQVIRLGDTSSHGGSMVSASGLHRVNGIVVCVSGDVHSCPLKGHGRTAVTASRTFTSNDRPVIATGDSAGCGAVMTSGSPDTVTDWS
jgi:uncharacterized Zn-binding protein involved in type VI secretion